MQVRMKKAAVLGPLLVMAMAAPVAAATEPQDGSDFEEAVSGRLGVVSTEDPRATAAALDVLRQGGNAVDAVIAATFTIGVTKPESCGVGGGGFLIARAADGGVAALDFRETAPLSENYNPRRGMKDTGPVFFEETGRGVVGVPGVVAGMGEAFDKLGSGRVTWPSLLRDAIAHADGGFVGAKSTTDAIEDRFHHLALFPESERLLLAPAAQAYLTRTPARFTFSEYARVLETVAKHGPGSFYSGWIAERLAYEMQATSGYEDRGDESELVLSDLTSYQPLWREPVSTSYRGYKVFGVPAPAAGPTAVIEALNVLEDFDLKAMGRGSADYLHLVAEAKKLAWADRNAYGGDPGKVVVPEATLTSKAYAAERRELISMTQAQSYSHGTTEVEPGTATGDSPEGAQTTSLSVVDRDGNAVALTCSIEKALGSAYIAPGLGFLLNGELFDFNDTKLDPSPANAPAPGKRPRSSQSPMIVVKAGVPALVTGGQGGTSIPGGVLHSILNTVDFDLDVARALDAPRVDASVSATDAEQGLKLVIEDSRFAESVLETLAARGHALQLRGEYGHGAVVSAVGVDPVSKLRYAAGDPRADNAAPAAETG